MDGVVRFLKDQPLGAVISIILMHQGALMSAIGLFHDICLTQAIGHQGGSAAALKPGVMRKPGFAAWHGDSRVKLSAGSIPAGVVQVAICC
ncbi:hypothetical protein KKI24_01515 [bacterium]|nr:hypothetical protein [bacterium]